MKVHMRPNILFRRQYFLQEVFFRFYFLIKITAGKFSIKGDNRFHILLLVLGHILFIFFF